MFKSIGESNRFSIINYQLFKNVITVFAFNTIKIDLGKDNVKYM